MDIDAHQTLKVNTPLKITFLRKTSSSDGQLVTSVLKKKKNAQEM